MNNDKPIAKRQIETNLGDLHDKENVLCENANKKESFKYEEEIVGRIFKILSIFFLLSFSVSLISLIVQYLLDVYYKQWAELISLGVELISTSCVAVILSFTASKLMRKKNTEKLRESEEELYNNFQKSIDSAVGKSE